MGAPRERERDASAKSGSVFRSCITREDRLDTLVGVFSPVRRVCLTVGVLITALGVALSGCTVSPPPAPQSTDTTHNTPPPPPHPTQIIMGIDSIGAGFNPHLLSICRR